MRISQQSLVMAFGSLVFAVACAPRLTISHADHTHPAARVYVDGEDEGALRFGQTTSTRIDAGPHSIVVLDEETGRCVWSGDDEGWSIWVIDEVELTLLPPAAEIKPIIGEDEDEE